MLKKTIVYCNSLESAKGVIQMDYNNTNLRKKIKCLFTPHLSKSYISYLLVLKGVK